MCILILAWSFTLTFDNDKRWAAMPFLKTSQKFKTNTAGQVNSSDTFKSGCRCFSLHLPLPPERSDSQSKCRCLVIRMPTQTLTRHKPNKGPSFSAASGVFPSCHPACHCGGVSFPVWTGSDGVPWEGKWPLRLPQLSPQCSPKKAINPNSPIWQVSKKRRSSICKRQI